VKKGKEARKWNSSKKALILFFSDEKLFSFLGEETVQASKITDPANQRGLERVTVASFWHKCACLAGDVSSTTLQPYEKPPKKLRSVEMLLNNFPMRIIILPFLHPFPLSSLTCFSFPP
jgi:hypothetical protein